MAVRVSGWLGPVFGDASAVPTEQGVGSGEPSVAASLGECLGYRCEHRSVVVGKRGSCVLSVQDAELVAQDHYLQVLDLPVRTAMRANDVRKRYKMRYTRSGSAEICHVQQPRPSFGHPPAFARVS